MRYLGERFNHAHVGGKNIAIKNNEKKERQYVGTRWNHSEINGRPIRYRGKMVGLGYFKDEKEAALAFDKKVREINPKKENLTFLLPGEKQAKNNLNGLMNV
eukprot:UN18994